MNEVLENDCDHQKIVLTVFIQITKHPAWPSESNESDQSMLSVSLTYLHLQESNRCKISANQWLSLQLLWKQTEYMQDCWE